MLTIVAMIFISLTLAARAYGMDFEYVPKLIWHWFYLWAFWVVTIGIAGVMLAYFGTNK